MVGPRGTNTAKHPGLVGIDVPTAAPRRTSLQVAQDRLDVEIKKTAKKSAAAELKASKAQCLEDVTEKASIEDAGYTTPVVSKRRKQSLQKTESVELQELFVNELAEMDDVLMGPPPVPLTRQQKKKAPSASTITSEAAPSRRTTDVAPVQSKVTTAASRSKALATRPTPAEDTPPLAAKSKAASSRPKEALIARPTLGKGAPPLPAKSKAADIRPKEALITRPDPAKDAPPLPAKSGKILAFNSSGEPVGHRVGPPAKVPGMSDDDAGCNNITRALRQKVETAIADSATEESDPAPPEAVESETEDDSDVKLKAKVNSGSETEYSDIKPPPKKKARTAPKVDAKGKAKKGSTDQGRQLPQRGGEKVHQESSEVEVVEEITHVTKKRKSTSLLKPSHQKDSDKISIPDGGTPYMSLPF